MIKFSLVCDAGHAFDSWFASGAVYDMQVADGLVRCAVCDSAEVAKAIMAPAVASRRERMVVGEILPPQPTMAELPDAPSPVLLDETHRAVRDMMGALRAEIMAKTIDVGAEFSTEARKIHDGVSPERPIRGEATIEEAHALIEDGIMIAPVPAVPEELN